MSQVERTNVAHIRYIVRFH